MTYELGFLDSALKEWRKLDAQTRDQFKKKLAERLDAPHVPASKLSGAKDRYKIKLRSLGYRLVYDRRVHIPFGYLRTREAGSDVIPTVALPTLGLLTLPSFSIGLFLFSRNMLLAPHCLGHREADRLAVAQESRSVFSAHQLDADSGCSGYDTV